MPDMGDKVCLNHTSRPAVTRCATCFRPLCEECVIEANDGGHYCSEKCAGSAHDAHGRIAAVNAATQRMRIKRFVRHLVTLLIIGAIVAAGYWFWQSNRDDVKDWKDVGKDLGKEAQRAAAAGANAVKDRVKK